MAKIYDGCTYLDEHLVANDYYDKDGQVVGQWVGKGAAAFGIEGREIQADDQSFENLRDHKTPDGREKLTPRWRRATKDGKGDVRFFDFQCSAQKSVSVMAVMMDDRRLRDAYEKAVMVAFRELEQFAARRSGLSREAEFTGNLCATKFTHDASRALDPQLHTHFVVANVTTAVDGKRYALTESEMCAVIRYAGKVYQNEVARSCIELGYEIEEKRGEKNTVVGFEIKGVSGEILERFSKRRAEVEEGIEKFKAINGREPTAAEVSKISRETRRKTNMAEITTPAVRAKQLKQLVGKEQDDLQHLLNGARTDCRDGLVPIIQSRSRQTLSAAAAHVYERASVLPGNTVLAEALNMRLGRANLAELKQELSGGTLINLEGKESLKALFTTKEGLAMEQWSVNRVNETNGRFTAFSELPFVPSSKLSADQGGAVTNILRSRNGVISFRGVAGAGKTTTLQELNRGLNEAGHETIYLSPTNAAKDVLIREGFENAATVSKFLIEAQRKGIKEGAVLIVDESGLQSNKQGAQLLQLAKRANARVIFVGDTRQHVSVEAGDFLRILETHSSIQKEELTGIWRQRNEQYRAAEKMMAVGNVGGGFATLDKLGWVREGKGDYLTNAAKDYLRLLGKEGKGDVIAVAPTHAEGQVMTENIRAGLKAGGLIGGGTKMVVAQSLNLTVQQKKSLKNYRPGQMVTFMQKVDGGEKSRCYEILTTKLRPEQIRYRRQSGVECVRTVHKKIVQLKNHLGKVNEIELTPATAARLDVGEAREIEVSVGDKILVGANDRGAKLINGEIWDVKKINRDGSMDVSQVKEIRKQQVTVSTKIPAGFRSFTHGYVVTSHKSQGLTKNHVVVAAAHLDGKAGYVSTSRGRESCVVHTPDKATLMKGLPRSGERSAALDVRPDWVLPSREIVSRRKGYWLHAGYELRDVSPSAVRETLTVQRSLDARKMVADGQTREVQTYKER
jgi:conjugative relaxase-like TrwC/TraI family protein